MHDGGNRYRRTADAARRYWSKITATGGDQVMILSADHTDEMDYSAVLISTGISVLDRQWLQAILFYHGRAGIDFGYDVIPAALVLGSAADRRLEGDLSARRRNPRRPASCASLLF